MATRTSRIGAARLREVLFSGKPTRGQLFSARSLPSDRFRLAIVAPGKIFKKASQRNKVRRRWREAVRVSSFPKIDLVVTARPGSDTARFVDLVAEARSLAGCYSTQP